MTRNGVSRWKLCKFGDKKRKMSNGLEMACHRAGIGQKTRKIGQDRAGAVRVNQVDFTL